MVIEVLQYNFGEAYSILIMGLKMIIVVLFIKIYTEYEYLTEQKWKSG